MRSDVHSTNGSIRALCRDVGRRAAHEGGARSSMYFRQSLLRSLAVLRRYAYLMGAASFDSSSATSAFRPSTIC